MACSRVTVGKSFKEVGKRPAFLEVVEESLEGHTGAREDGGSAQDTGGSLDDLAGLRHTGQL